VGAITMPDPANSEVITMLTGVAFSLRQMHDEQLGGFGNIPIEEKKLLNALSKVPPQASIPDVAEESRMAPDKVANPLGELERKGLVSRLPRAAGHPVVELTDTGKELVERAHAIQGELADQAAATLSDQEKQQLLGLLRRLNVPRWVASVR
jgi:DNA-binding MarR family transcriptional regulator